MKSQLRFVMHANDESDFVSQVLSDESVCLVDGPRWKTSTPQTARSLDGITGTYVLIWSSRDRAVLSASYVSASDDWYCEAESATIQFLRSQTNGPVITEGRIAISTAETGDEVARAVERRFKGLVRFIKKHYANSQVQWSNPNLPVVTASEAQSANPSKPDAQVWLGPHALRWMQQDRKRCIKQFSNSLVEARLVEAAI